jgi:hypothetical protein
LTKSYLELNKKNSKSLKVYFWISCPLIYIISLYSFWFVRKELKKIEKFRLSISEDKETKINFFWKRELYLLIMLFFLSILIIISPGIIILAFYYLNLYKF